MVCGQRKLRREDKVVEHRPDDGQYEGAEPADEVVAHVALQVEAQHGVLESLASNESGDEHTDGGEEHQHGSECGIDERLLGSECSGIAPKHTRPDKPDSPGKSHRESDKEKDPDAAKLLFVG